MDLQDKERYERSARRWAMIVAWWSWPGWTKRMPCAGCWRLRRAGDEVRSGRGAGAGRRPGRGYDAHCQRVGEAPAVRFDRRRITLGDVETMVLAAKQRSLYELTDAISARDKPRALALLHGLLNASDGGEDSAIGHLYMLARTFRQMVSSWRKTSATRAPSGRRYGRGFACLRSLLRIDSPGPPL